MNRDGEVNVADLVYCTRTLLRLHIPEHSCDANNDSNVNVFDVIFIRKILFKLA